MVEAAASALTVEVYKDGRTIFSYIGSKCEYADDFKKNYTRLDEAVSKLSKRKEDVETEIKQNRNKQATKECDDWRYRVAEAQDKCKELELKYLKETRRRSGLHRLWARANLSKKMFMKVDELRSLIQDGKLENGIMVDRPPDRVRTIQAPTTNDKPSLHGIVEEIIGFLGDRGVDRIGLWGMVGTGKTTIMQNLNNHSRVAQMFDIVLWVTVSKATSLENVQDVVAQRLKLRLNEGTNPLEVSRRISMELDGMRYLLILDELWDSLDLVQVGFPNQKSSKVILASRFRHVCTDMDVDELVNVKRVSDADAWKIFEEKVGRSLRFPGVRPIAQQVIKECAGLPLLIDRVAKTFRNKNDVRLWREGLRSLRRCTSINNRAMDEVFDFLRFCYDDLENHGKKLCFLYGAMFPEDCDILVDYLLECWICEGYIQDVEGFRTARDKGHNIMHDLISLSLLEISEKKKHIRMNKVIRGMALHISAQSARQKYLVRTREGLKEVSNEEDWESSTGISLIGNALCVLPDAPNCEHLSSLLLQKNHELLTIPEMFFTSMKSLRILDLHRTGITLLPSSLSRLTALNALYLNYCASLIQLPSCMEELKQLKVLDIRGTKILPFPALIGGLTQLKCLRMSLSNFDTRNGSLDQNHNVITKLSLLEELVIDVDLINRCNDRAFQIVVDHIATLPLLTALTFFFPEVDSLYRFINTSPSWKDSHFTFEFHVGYPQSTAYSILDCFDYQIRRCLKYGKGNGTHPTIIEVLKETEVVELVGHINFLSLSDFGMNNMNNLRGCLLKDCDDIECIVDGDSIGTYCGLESLERMHISNNPRLHSIWKGPVASGSLGQLTSLIIQNCIELTNIFSNGLIKQMFWLQNLSIEECNNIEEIIVELENPSLDSDALPSLKTIILRGLPKLRSITVNNTLNWPSLEKLEVFSCSALLKLPFTENNAVNLKSIEGHQTWWDILEWQESSIKSRLLQICNLS